MKLNIDLYDTTGKVTSKVAVPQAFDVKIDPALIALAIRVYLANQRQATSKVKSRGEINKTTRKVWKQKGTGRARHGSKAAPIFVGGGVAHGPSGNQNYDLKLPKKMRQKAILSAVTQSIIDDKVIMIDGLTDLKSTTKSVNALIATLKLENTKLLCLLDQPITDFIRGAKNIKNISVSQAKRTNVYEIVNAQKILLHKPALEILAETFSSSLPKKIEAKPETEAKPKTAAKPKTKKAVKAE
jgi:large subunit ribosomal protein L4